MRKGGHKLLGLAALASLMLIGGTWAAWTQEITAGNEFMPGTYETSLDEKFTPPTDWSPGTEQEKRVRISNKGTVPVMAKAVITQSWIRREDVYATRLNASGDVAQEPVAPFKGEAFPLTFQTDEGEEYASIPNFKKNAVVLLDSGKTADSSLSLGLSAVSTVDAARGKWLLLNEVPDAKGQYTLYYMGIIEPGSSTPEFLESVTLNRKLGRTITGKETRFIKMEDGSTKKVTIDSVNAEFGYDSAKYTMDIKGSTVQATKAAVEEIFGTGDETLAYLAGQVAESGIFESAEVKTLKFEESNGRMVYVPYRNEEGAETGNWFMSEGSRRGGGSADIGFGSALFHAASQVSRPARAAPNTRCFVSGIIPAQRAKSKAARPALLSCEPQLCPGVDQPGRLLCSASGCAVVHLRRTDAVGGLPPFHPAAALRISPNHDIGPVARLILGRIRDRGSPRQSGR